MSFINKSFSFNIWKGLLIGCLSLSLSACINLPKNTERYKLFYLKSLPFTQEEKNALPAVEWQLTIEEPSCDGRLNTDKIVVQEFSAQLTHIAGALWVDRLPHLVQQLLLNLFENSSKIEGVGLPIEGLDADYVLLTDIRDFELVVSNKKEIRIRLFAKLMRLRDREVIGARTFEKAIPLKENNIEEVIQSFLEAMNSVGKELVSWCLHNPERPSESKR